jgi:thioredoxin reductase (NADPH)
MVFVHVQLGADMTFTDLLILGAGPAGYTSAIYASRAGMRTILLTGPQPGGQLVTTTDVENFPGYPQGIKGPEMMNDFFTQAERFGTIIQDSTATAVTTNPSGGFDVTLDGDPIHASALVVATGATAKRLGTHGEDQYFGRGVSSCATCDGFFFRDKNVVVIGGGDTAMEEALYLSKLCKHVTVVNRTATYKASVVMLDRAHTMANISFLENLRVMQILGDETKVTGVNFYDPQNTISFMQIDGVFVAIGHSPNSAIVANLVDLDANGYIKTVPGSTVTRTHGLFAAGDVADPRYRQAITAAGTGCMAALDAETYLQSV